MRNVLVAIALTLASPALADRLPVSPELQQLRDTWVDPKRKTNRKCPDRPYRPAWAMVHGDRPLAQIFVEMAGYMYSAERNRQINKAGRCSCETLLPDWEPLRERYEQVIASVEPRLDLLQEDRREYYRDLKQRVREQDRKLWDEWRDIAPLCRGVK